MAATRRKQTAKEAAHRGRIQAQGGGIEKAVSWKRQTPPTESEMMEMVAHLESMLTPAERRARQKGFEQLRRLIRRASMIGGLPPLQMSYTNVSVSGVRVDIEVLTGLAGVLDSKK